MSEPYWVALGPKATPVDYVGDWAAGTPYLPGQVVRHNGADHLAVNPSTGQAPTGPGIGVLPVIGMGLALPASPYDGQEYILVDSLTAPTYSWRLRYVAAKATNKWVFIGGAPAVSEVATQEMTSNTAYNPLTTPGPSVTVPAAGNYVVRWGAWTKNSATAVQTMMAIRRVPAAAADVDSVYCELPTTAQVRMSRTKVFTGLAAGTQLVAEYRVWAASTGYYSDRWLEVEPIAVGG